MHFERFEPIEFERHDLAPGCFLNMVASCHHVEAMNESLRQTNRLNLLLIGSLELAE
jgi:hypothetical protein